MKRRADANANPGVGKPWREVLDRLEPGHEPAVIMRQQS